MPDRSLRLTMPVGAVLPREGRPTPPSPPKESDEPSNGGTSEAPDNPFAPPPEGAPDRPWQPRPPRDGAGDGTGDEGGNRSPWGSQWSDRQPGRAQGGGFGERPGGGPGQGGPDGSGRGPSGPGGMRWDPTDPAQRRARFALLSGMWGFFFGLFGWPYVALLLGALALYWGVSALRAKPAGPNPDAPAPASAPGTPPSRPQATAAISGLVTGSLALLMVASVFTAKLVYSDYYECRADALTNAAKHSCDDLLPKNLRPLLGTSD
ncbi:hypothetical protein [Streptomyces beihaiensis]|uniref:Integral membrane protein n=1 Tax=Streptomyces beihaiensis TaxID=2984495 RepID=A0ABT3U1M2_9ACTN|nr:hypothetical protein [Streptomyces beihaiensis]MCX3063164.1 hypothetical protein [Streptomyces beihaiensis]